MTSTISAAEMHAKGDLALIDIRLTGTPPNGAVVDGSMYSPSWRALPGGEAVWEMEDPDAVEAYQETLDKGTDERCLMWDEGCLWIEVEAEDP